MPHEPTKSIVKPYVAVVYIGLASRRLSSVLLESRCGCVVIVFHIRGVEGHPKFLWKFQFLFDLPS